jgi:hypothetical protein
VWGGGGLVQNWVGGQRPLPECCDIHVSDKTLCKKLQYLKSWSRVLLQKLTGF